MIEGRIRVGAIGCGGRGRAHLACLQSFEDVELVAVCDSVPEALERVGREFGVARRYADAGEFLDTEELDAVIVATPAHLNAVAAQPVLERGIDTLIEKPPGMSAAETRRLRDAAQRSGARAMVAWDRRFNPFVLEARKAIEERGPIVQLVGEFHKSMANLDTGRFPEIVIDNMLLETTSHAIDLVRALAGSDVDEVHSVVRRRISKYKDVHAAVVSFENGCVASIIANYTTDTRLERYEIHGHYISAYLEGVSRGELVCDGERRALSGEGPSAMAAEDRFFFDCIRDDRPVVLPAANLDEAVKTMDLWEAIVAGLTGA